jgi:hypothetical protein
MCARGTGPPRRSVRFRQFPAEDVSADDGGLDLEVADAGGVDGERVVAEDDEISELAAGEGALTVLLVLGVGGAVGERAQRLGRSEGFGRVQRAVSRDLAVLTRGWIPFSGAPSTAGQFDAGVEVAALAVEQPGRVPRRPRAGTRRRAR